MLADWRNYPVVPVESRPLPVVVVLAACVATNRPPKDDPSDGLLERAIATTCYGPTTTTTWHSFVVASSITCSGTVFVPSVVG